MLGTIQRKVRSLALSKASLHSIAKQNGITTNCCGSSVENCGRYSKRMNRKLREYSGTARLDVRPLSTNTLDFEFETIIEMQEKACDLYRDRPSLGTKKGNAFEWITFGELNTMVAAFRTVLHSKFDVKSGDKVALISNNRLEWAASMYAVLSLGAQIVPM
jgi:hypothetical protein